MFIAYQIWTNFLAYFFAVTMTPGVFVQGGLRGYIMSGLVYSFMIMLLPKVIEFFKINVNFWSFLLVGSILSTGFYYAMRYMFFGFITFEAFPPTRAIFGLMRGISLNESQVLIFAGVFTILIMAINQKLLEQ